jgi:predicted dehydrogenase
MPTPRAATPLKAAVAGFGMAASCHAGAYRRIDGVELVAAYSDHLGSDRAAILAACGPGVRVFDDYDRFIAESGADIVSVCTLPDRHADQIIAAARAGKHVAAEKPICVTAAELEAVNQAVRQAGVQFTACFQEFHYGAFLAAIDMVEQGLLGRVHLAEVDYYNGIGPWVQQYWWTRTARHGVSSMVNCGCHAMMLLTLLMGGEMPEEVTSYRARSASPSFADYEFDPTQISLFRYSGGRVGKVTSCLDAIQPYTFRVSAVGSEGSVIDDQFYTRRIAGLESTRWSRMGARTIGDATVIGPDMYVDFLTSFVATARTGTPMPRTNLDKAYRMHRMLFAAAAAAELGRAVPIDDTATSTG